MRRRCDDMRASLAAAAVVLAIVIGATATLVVLGSEAAEPSDGRDAATGTISRVQPVSEAPVIVSNPSTVYDPLEAGEAIPMPDRYRQLLERDQILPVYEPTFVTIEAVDWLDQSLVIGISIDGDSRAYPVTFLSGREMVIDNVGGIPLLVSW